MNDPIELLIASCWSLACGAAGWFANRWISDVRDRRGRRLELLSYISAWRSKLERIPPTARQAIYEAYVNHVHEFSGLYDVVASDRPTDSRIKQLGEALRNIRHGDIYDSPIDTDRRDVVCGPIDNLREYIKNLKD